eukprot:scaffold36312_cov132-Isochrysis_galbana.AAC.1
MLFTTNTPCDGVESMMDVTVNGMTLLSYAPLSTPPIARAKSLSREITGMLRADPGALVGG